MSRHVAVAVLLTSLSVAGPVAAEVPPELPASVYAQRRARLVQKLGGCAAILRSHATSSDPDPYFYYLTGIDEPGAQLVLSPRARVVRSEIRLPARNPRRERWTGHKQPISAKLRTRYKVDRVGVVRGTPKSLQNGLRRSRCYAHLRFPGKKSDIKPKVLGRLLRGYSARSQQRWEELERMRAVKGAAELARMRRAIAITARGHEAAVRSMKKGAVERQVSAAIRTAFFAHGATGLAFPSIVGSGPNGAVLHWVKNDRVLVGDELVVVDIGASYGHYAADITRTYPVSGRFSDEHKKIYELVLRVQKKVIAAVKPGISMAELHRIASDTILAAGYDLPHSVGHFVGLEVHDVGDRGAGLEAGMIITVEPGIYLRGRFGVRIEDMVRVTPRGGEVMTGQLPRTPDELEAWMKKVRAAGK